MRVREKGAKKCFVGGLENVAPDQLLEENVSLAFLEAEASCEVGAITKLAFSHGKVGNASCLAIMAI